MALKDITSPQAVRDAVTEYERIGQSAFLKRYDRGPSKTHFLVWDNGKEYDAKAIVAAAHGHQFPLKGPLIDFHGGEPVRRLLEDKLGFKVRVGPSLENNLKIGRASPEIDQLIAADLSEPPPRAALTISRIVRDSVLVRRVKAAHGHRCQLCGTTIELPGGRLYAEAHHLRPLGGEHQGPDCEANIVVVCPNHHAMLDFGAIRLDEKELLRQKEHVLSPEFIRYHNERIFGRMAGAFLDHSSR